MIDMLRSNNLKKFTDVYTADGERVGAAMRYVHRPILEVDEEMKLYPTYLIVRSILMGGSAYIPTVFIDDYDPQTNRLTLSVNFETIQDETWNREPRFAALGQGVYEELAD